MLQDIQKHTKGPVAKVIVGLIVISFAFFGIQSILVSGGGDKVAEVNGEEISGQELQQAVYTQKRRLAGMMGENLDPALLDDDLIRPRALEGLINRELQMQSAKSMNLAVSEREIGMVVGSMEQFQIDGVFSPEVYKGVLASEGYTPAYFKASLRDDLVLSQLHSGLAGSEFVTASELQLNTRLVAEQRDLRFFSIPRDKFSSNAPATEEQIIEYYDSHQDAFRTPESVDIDYLELTLDDFREAVTEEAVLAAYEDAKQGYQYQTQNRVSHILFEADTDNVGQRIAQAQEQLASGVAFAEVAAEYSDDVGSAQKGGDLGFSEGATFPAAMEEVIVELEQGAVSAPIETDAGTHLVVVTERREGEMPGLEEMRPGLENSLQEDEARVVLLRTVESLKDLSFNAEDLDKPAEELGLTVVQLDGVTRIQSEGLFANASLQKAAYSDDVLLAGNNSEVIEISSSSFVVLRVRNHHESQVEPLASVREEVVAAVNEEVARQAVEGEAQRAVEQLRAGDDIVELASSNDYPLVVELGVDRRNTAIPPYILRRTFELSAPAADAPSVDFLIAPNGDAVVLQLLQVIDGDYATLAEAEQAQLQQLYINQLSNLVSIEFQRGLRERADITVL